MLDLTDITAIDNHCHLPLEGPPPRQAAELARFFTEASDPQVLAEQTPYSLFFRRAIRDLAAVVGLEGEALEDQDGNLKVEAVLAKRAEYSAEEWFRLMVQKANLRALYADTGYPRSGAWTVEHAQEVVNSLEPAPRVYSILRIERILEDLISESATFEQCEEALRNSIRQARSQGAVGLKSIIAYRCGLDIQSEKTSKPLAKEAFLKLKAEADRTGSFVRVADKALLDYIVPVALEEAAREQLPVQFHTGFGDTDVDLVKANPAYLKPIFENAALRKAPVVLLHCYPYIQEASYLAAMYPHVYMDFSLASPLVAFGGGRALEEALGLAPSTKILYGSDAWGVPDIIYLGSLHSRKVLARVLNTWIEQGWLDQKEAHRIALNILQLNSKTLYQ
ncbi:MAG TPA: amidohydrolase family protein [Chloroflexia bacterium]|nr:amidohydrolase family protein [Chloroflexia bacterium]